LDNYAIVENKIIVNVFVASQEFAESNYPEAILCPAGFGPGDKYEDGEFSRVVNVVIDESVDETIPE
jgi:hypothetical protein